MKQGSAYKGCIVIIDTNESILDVMQLILERQEYEVFVKQDHNDIEGFIENKKISLLFLDVLLYGKSGKQICKQLKANTATNYFPIILMSAAKNYLLDFEQHGADNILEKPFDINTLITITRSTFLPLA